MSRASRPGERPPPRGVMGTAGKVTLLLAKPRLERAEPPCVAMEPSCGRGGSFGSTVSWFDLGLNAGGATAYRGRSSGFLPASPPAAPLATTCAATFCNPMAASARSRDGRRSASITTIALFASHPERSLKTHLRASSVTPSCTPRSSRSTWERSAPRSSTRTRQRRWRPRHRERCHKVSGKRAQRGSRPVCRCRPVFRECVYEYLPLE